MSPSEALIQAIIIFPKKLSKKILYSEVLFKLLRTDSVIDFDDLAFEFFNTDGSPDTTIAPTTTRGSFIEHQYSAGLRDNGGGDILDEFSGFQIKIVMQGTNCAAPPRLKDLRILALDKGYG